MGRPPNNPLAICSPCGGARGGRGRCYVYRRFPEAFGLDTPAEFELPTNDPVWPTYNTPPYSWPVQYPLYGMYFGNGGGSSSGSSSSGGPSGERALVGPRAYDGDDFDWMEDDLRLADHTCGHDADGNIYTWDTTYEQFGEQLRLRFNWRKWRKGLEGGPVTVCGYSINGVSPGPYTHEFYRMGDIRDGKMIVTGLFRWWSDTVGEELEDSETTSGTPTGALLPSQNRLHFFDLETGELLWEKTAYTIVTEYLGQDLPSVPITVQARIGADGFVYVSVRWAPIVIVGYHIPIGAGSPMHPSFLKIDPSDGTLVGFYGRMYGLDAVGGYYLGDSSDTNTGFHEFPDVNKAGASHYFDVDGEGNVVLGVSSTPAGGSTIWTTALLVRLTPGGNNDDSETDQHGYHSVGYTEDWVKAVYPSDDSEDPQVVSRSNTGEFWGPETGSDILEPCHDGEGGAYFLMGVLSYDEDDESYPLYNRRIHHVTGGGTAGFDWSRVWGYITPVNVLSETSLDEFGKYYAAYPQYMRRSDDGKIHTLGWGAVPGSSLSNMGCVYPPPGDPGVVRLDDSSSESSGSGSGTGNPPASSSDSSSADSQSGDDEPPVSSSSGSEDSSSFFSSGSEVSS